MESTTLSVIRTILFATLILGILGILAELLLLEHTEGFWQQMPLYLLFAGLGVLVWHAIDRRAASVRVVQGTMLLFVASGAIGAILHYKGNVEFELEMNAASRGFDLFMEAMMGATPALAPGAMIQLGLVGLAYTFRHPALTFGRATAHRAEM
ncbi:MAG: hypothetical protein ACR2G6_12745 [Gemmatimonadaceae bacterium]